LIKDPWENQTEAQVSSHLEAFLNDSFYSFSNTL
jgi:hypothetical protein